MANSVYVQQEINIKVGKRSPAEYIGQICGEDAVAETVAGLHQHALDFVDFKQVGEAMICEWNEGLSAIGGNKGE